MSLVAYDYGSDEESDGEDNPEETIQKNPAPTAPVNNGIQNHHQNVEPKKDTAVEEVVTQTMQLKLPVPKKTNDLNVEEEDDEFLRKKAVPQAPLPAKPTVRNGKVQISIPSMKDFQDDDDVGNGRKKDKPVQGAALPKKSTNLLSLLPKPRTALFDKPVASTSSASGSAGFSKRLVPDSVANRPRSVPVNATKPTDRRNEEGKTSAIAKTGPPALPTHKEGSDDEADDDDGDVDFFSFNKVDALPTVSANEISAMVARKAAKISETIRKYTEPEERNETHVIVASESEASSAQPHNPLSQPSEDLASESALAALIGGNRAKRARVEQVDLIEITSADIVPSREDFLRRQLQDETGYVPTGHLVGDWTCTSKRKSHITQLANKAQANAHELEAMWAANRQSRRQTQSKYGF